jgi:hypothetical protein
MTVITLAMILILVMEEEEEGSIWGSTQRDADGSNIDISPVFSLISLTRSDLICAFHCVTSEIPQQQTDISPCMIDRVIKGFE